MKEENFNRFIDVNKGKVVTATIKNPKRVVIGILEDGEIKLEKNQQKEKIKISHQNVKALDVVVTKAERMRRRKEKLREY